MRSASPRPADTETTSHGKPLTRGGLATRTGCNIETVRYYERIGLLPPPPRSAGGHRLYGPELVRRLGFIRRSRDLGFAIDEIRELLRLVDGSIYTCAQVEEIARDHIRQIRQKIADLRRLQRVFESMAAQCTGGEVPECPIIDALFAKRGEGRPPQRRDEEPACPRPAGDRRR